MQAASSSDSVAKDVAAAFVQFDTGSKGFLTRHELRAVYISLLGHAPSKVEMDAMLPKSDTPGAGMELPALCELMSRKLAAQDPDEVVRRAFRAFDTKHKGYIAIDDLEAAMAEVAPHLPSRTVNLVFAQLDADRDGRVSYRDFHSMMSARGGPAARTVAAR